MKLPNRLTLNGRAYKIEFGSTRKKTWRYWPGVGSPFGHCNRHSRKIKVHPILRSNAARGYYFVTVAHELMHAADWRLKHKHILKCEKAVGKILMALVDGQKGKRSEKGIRGNRSRRRRRA